MITIQPYQSQYKNEVIDLVLHIQQKEFQVPVTLDDQPDLHIIPDFYQIKNGNFWVALNEQNELVGTIALIDSGNNIGTLRKMFVKKNYRGKQYGIAQALWDALLAWATQYDFKAIYLGTIERLKAAQRFYERNGFQITPESSLPPEFPIMPVDTLFYKYNLLQ